jgi:hypothetical protein
MRSQKKLCSKVERRLARGGDPGEPRWSAHLEICASCQASAAAQRRVTAGLKALADDQVGLRLDASRRARILREVRVLSPELAPTRLRVPAYATLLAASLVLGFAYLISSNPVPDLSPRTVRMPAALGSPTDLRVSQEGKNVVLEWSDGREASYTVRQATSAKAVYTAPGVQVRGHRYVDRSPSDATVVYYLVE